jgi:hypothetical protein
MNYSGKFEFNFNENSYIYYNVIMFYFLFSILIQTHARVKGGGDVIVNKLGWC